jgi:hypothetical protein
VRLISSTGRSLPSSVWATVGMVEVTNPTTPVYQASFYSYRHLLRGVIKVYNDHAFIVSKRAFTVSGLT